MRVLVLGSGGREHALVWHLVNHGHDVCAVPGNGGIARIARCETFDLRDIGSLVSFCRRERFELTVVGPEAPLVSGVADEFRRHGLALFGPDKAGARLEGDKAFAKRLMQEQGIPTARFEVFDDPARARAYIDTQPMPVVIKAAGLAAGKGVVICETKHEAVEVLTGMLERGRFGPAGKTVVVEECLVGEEASITALCDGTLCRFLPASQDHKRLLDGDVGPNTGGMGAYAPAPLVTPEVQREVEERVFLPLVAGLRRRGIDYRGVIYAGIMLTADGVKVLEFNCRFGDPEAQVVLPLVQTDLAGLCLACLDGTLSGQELRWSEQHALCVVAAGSGYPDSSSHGEPVFLDTDGLHDVIVFHAGTRIEGEKLVTNGGRVLCVTGLGATLWAARERAYKGIGHVRFAGMRFRQDIGHRAFKTGRSSDRTD